jgi:hypothetical protein
MSRDQTGQQPHRRAGVGRVKGTGGRSQPARAKTLYRYVGVARDAVWLRDARTPSVSGTPASRRSRRRVRVHRGATRRPHECGHYEPRTGLRNRLADFAPQHSYPASDAPRGTKRGKARRWLGPWGEADIEPVYCIILTLQ